MKILKVIVLPICKKQPFSKQNFLRPLVEIDVFALFSQMKVLFLKIYFIKMNFVPLTILSKTFSLLHHLSSFPHFSDLCS